MSRLLAADHAREAAALQAEAARAEAAGAEAAEAGALLVEAANQWRLAGDADRCRALLAEVIAGGGEVGCFARAELVGLLLDSGAPDAASPQLSALAADPALTDGPCQLVAELLTDHGALTTALEWYDRAVAASDRPDVIVVQQRRRVRKRLGLPPDETDALAG